MIDCIGCELLRAKAKALAWHLAGRTPQHIAVLLTFEYTAEYYIEDGKLYRASTVAPYTPYLIKSF